MRMRPHMRIRRTLPALVPALVLAVAGACRGDPLEVQPVNEIPEERAIVDAATARAALEGAYDAIQDDVNAFYYAGDVTSNATIRNMWTQIYKAINRANVVIAKVPTVPGLSQAARDDILGQAYFLRALNYHNLVKFWGGVPLRL